MLEPHDFIRKIEDLVSDEAFHQVLNRLEESWTNKWKLAKTPAEREAAWALVSALDAIWTEMRSIADDKKITAFNTRRTLRPTSI